MKMLIQESYQYFYQNALPHKRYMYQRLLQNPLHPEERDDEMDMDTRDYQAIQLSRKRQNVQLQSDNQYRLHNL